jgi:hypothetical protein
MSHFIQMVADYGVGDPAFGEVIQKLLSIDPELKVHPTSVPSFSTLATGFWINQYAINDSPNNFIIYSNTAPRKDTKQERKNNEGEKLCYARLDNGCKIVAVNAGHCFSFVKHRLDNFNLVKIPNQGSQFRSRDFYPEAVVRILKGDQDIIGQELELSLIPDLPNNQLASVDGYGNLKSTIKRTDVEFNQGQKVKIRLNGVKRMGIYADGNFEVKEGELAFAPGSSGEEGQEFLEIFLRGGSAWEYFEKPSVESEIGFESV